VRPAINVGISVSRVGGNAQIKAMKKVAGTMRIDLAQYRELESFAQFGSELDKSSQRQIDRGERVVEVLKQPQFQPVSVEEQICIIWAVTNGKLDDIPVSDVKRFENELREYMREQHSDLLDELRTEGVLTDEREDKLEQAVDKFKESFSPSEDVDTDDEDEDETDDLDTLRGDVESQEERAEEAEDEPAE
jgi:F-type H+-transporting ATPase subunit alpha